MKIIRLESENVKRITAVSIEPDGNMVVIGGKNGSGKTSCLDSIAFALGGKTAIQSDPIRKGEESASIVVELDDLIVRRKFTAKGSTLTVESREGAKYPSPQAMLDKIVGKLSFDPLEFSRMKPEQQAATLRELVGIDHRELDMRRKIAFEKRTAVNRDVKALAANLAAAVKHDDAPESEVVLQDLLDERTALQDRAKEHAAKQRAIGVAEANLRLADATVGNLERQIEELQVKLEHAKEARDEHMKFVKAAKVAASKSIDPDFTEIDQRLATAESTNRKVRENAKRAEIAAGLDAKRKAADKLTAEITKIDKTKETDLREAKFPIDGLGFGENGVTFGGIPLEQASSAEATRISASIGIACNPELRVMFIRDGSLLDDDSMAMVAEMAEECDVQFWIEVVGEGRECSVIIENGAVKLSENAKELAHA